MDLEIILLHVLNEFTEIVLHSLKYLLLRFLVANQ